MSKKESSLAALKVIADNLGVDLGGGEIAISTPGKGVIARTHDGALEVRVSSNTIEIDSPRSPGIRIELVDHTKDTYAPKEAVYEIQAYTLSESGGRISILNGDFYSIYVGHKGLILDDASRRRARDLPIEEP